MRGSQLCPEANIEGGKTKTNAWEGVRNAIFACPVRGFLFLELDNVLALPPCPKEANAITHTIDYDFEGWIVWSRVGKRGLGCLEQDILELPYTEAGDGGSWCRHFQCGVVVSDHCNCQADWIA